MAHALCAVLRKHNNNPKILRVMAKIININSAKKGTKRVAKKAILATAAAFAVAMQVKSEADVLRAAMDDIRQSEGDKAIIVDMYNDFGGFIA